MANLLRVGLALVLAMVALSAHALLPKTFQWTTGVLPGQSFASASAACNAVIAHYNATDTVWRYVFKSVNESGYCFVDSFRKADPNAPATPGVFAMSKSPAASCPANSTSASATECSCNATFEERDGQCRPKNPCPAGQHEEGGACVPDNCQPNEVRVNGLCVPEPPCPAGETKVNGVCKKNGCKEGQNMGDWETNGESITYYCEPYGGKYCTIKVNPSICVTFDGHTTCTGTGRLTGGTCTPGNNDGSGPGNKPNKGNNNNGDSSNPNGGNGGNGNGNNNGQGPNGGTGPGPGGGGNNPNPNPNPNPGTGPTNPGTGPDPTTPGNPHPPVTPGGGGGSGLPTPTSPPAPAEGNCPEGTTKVGKTCVKNPEPPNGNGTCPAGTVKIGSVCVYTHVPNGPETPGGGNGGDGDGDGDGDSMFSGSCLQGFVCEGDAVQCAIAREQHRRACRLFEDKSKESDLYDAEVQKDGMRDVTKELPGNEEIDIASKLSSVDALGGGGACIQDLQLTVWHQSVDLPISRLCTVLAQLGYILIAVSSLAAARILVKG